MTERCYDIAERSEVSDDRQHTQNGVGDERAFDNPYEDAPDANAFFHSFQVFRQMVHGWVSLFDDGSLLSLN